MMLLTRLLFQIVEIADFRRGRQWQIGIDKQVQAEADHMGDDRDQEDINRLDQPDRQHLGQLGRDYSTGDHIDQGSHADSPS